MPLTQIYTKMKHWEHLGFTTLLKDLGSNSLVSSLLSSSFVHGIPVSTALFFTQIPAYLLLRCSILFCQLSLVCTAGAPAKKKIKKKPFEDLLKSIGTTIWLSLGVEQCDVFSAGHNSTQRDFHFAG